MITEKLVCRTLSFDRFLISCWMCRFFWCSWEIFLCIIDEWSIWLHTQLYSPFEKAAQLFDVRSVVAFVKETHFYHQL